MTPANAAPVPMLDLPAEVEELWPELEPAVHRVLRSGQFIGGPEVEAFEEEAAAFLGVRHAVGLNSGTDALIIGLEALGVGEGDEVITTPFSFFATSESILRVGAVPVFVDIDPATLNIDPERIEEAITARTKAILPVHLFGLPARMELILEIARRHELKVLEDGAQAFGARCRGERVGSLGDAGAFSFYPTKTLGAYGDGGMLTTNDEGVAERARRLRNHGSRPGEKYLHDLLGHNSRLDAIQAAILRIKLPRVDLWNAERRSAARELHEALEDLPGVTPPPLHPEHVFHQFTIRLDPQRLPRAREALNADGIASQRFYPVPLSEQPVDRRGDTPPNAAAACERVLSLPVHSRFAGDTVQRIVAALQASA